MKHHANKYVLYISSQGLIAVSCGKDGVNSAPVRFSDVENEADSELQDVFPAVEDFEAWLEDRRSDDFVLLVDSIDEILKHESIPKLGFRDRKALLNKRRVQHFRDSEFTSINEYSARQDGKLVRMARMSALKQSVTLAPWLDIMLGKQIRIEAVTSPTLLSKQIADQIGARRSGLIVSMNPAGLRQTIVQDGEITFSRLATLSDASESEILGEVARSVNYMLMSQKIARDLIREGGFEIWIVVASDDPSHKYPGSLFIDQSAEIPIRLYDLSRQKIEVSADQPGLSLWSHLAQIRSSADYGSDRVTRFARLAWLRRSLLRGSAALAVVGTLMAFSVDWLIQASLPRLFAQDRSESQYDMEARDLEVRLAAYPASASEMKMIVDAAAKLLGRNVEAQSLLNIVARAVPATAGLDLFAVSWTPSDQAHMISAQGGAAPQQMINQDGQDIIEGSVLVVSGAVDPTWRKQDANKVIADFSEQLATLCECSVEGVKLPYDPSPDVGLSQEYGVFSAKPRSFQIEIRASENAGWQYKGIPTRLAAEISTSLMLGGLQ